MVDLVLQGQFLHDRVPGHEDRRCGEVDGRVDPEQVEHLGGGLEERTTGPLEGPAHPIVTFPQGALLGCRLRPAELPVVDLVEALPVPVGTDTPQGGPLCGAGDAEDMAHHVLDVTFPGAVLALPLRGDEDRLALVHRFVEIIGTLAGGLGTGVEGHGHGHHRHDRRQGGDAAQRLPSRIAQRQPPRQRHRPAHPTHRPHEGGRAGGEEHDEGQRGQRPVVADDPVIHGEPHDPRHHGEQHEADGTDGHPRPPPQQAVRGGPLHSGANRRPGRHPGRQQCRRRRRDHGKQPQQGHVPPRDGQWPSRVGEHPRDRRGSDAEGRAGARTQDAGHRAVGEDREADVPGGGTLRAHEREDAGHAGGGDGEHRGDDQQEQHAHDEGGDAHEKQGHRVGGTGRGVVGGAEPLRHPFERRGIVHDVLRPHGESHRVERQDVIPGELARSGDHPHRAVGLVDGLGGVGGSEERRFADKRVETG